uniref:IF rod domain-containing protein n=1 Tax=Oncorhynchus kisutch TaxID=8019 RepID=A0A8C7M5X6_ONCKI
ISKNQLTVIMSHSPERMSSSRRHFEDISSSSTSYQVRVSSPSPTRRDARTRSAIFTHGDSRGGTMRQEMVVLNDRLAVYINKVNSLEQQNKQLEMEIEGLQNRFVKPSGLRLLYEQIQCLAKMRVQWGLALADEEAMVGQLEMIKTKYEEALEKRKVATSARIALEKQLEQLEVKLMFLQRVQKQEIEELMAQVYSGHSSSQCSFALPDLLAALKQNQSQYNEIAAKILAEMDSWYKSKFEDITNKTTKHVDKARSVREEITSARKDIQNKECDLDALNDALEAEVNKTTERYKRELEDLQARIEALKLELETTKDKIAHHLREYQDLLDIKMALEIEITTYRKLIEGEDLQLSSMVKNLFWMSVELVEVMATEMVGGNGKGNGAGITVLIRTVKTEDDMLERNIQEKSYTVEGAADDTNEEQLKDNVTFSQSLNKPLHPKSFAMRTHAWPVTWT